MKPDILVSAPLYAPALVALEREFTVHKLWTAPDPMARIAQLAGTVRGGVAAGLGGFTREHIEALARLQIIACFGSASERLDLAAARERGIVVTHLVDDIADAVADVAVGLMIAVMRRIGAGDRFVRAGKWPQGAFSVGRQLRGKTCGIVGLGRIGRAVARRAAAFGMAVCYHGPRRKDDIDLPYYADLRAMAQSSDCLVLTCPLTDGTRNLVDAAILDALGAEGYLVNAARGPVVDQRALIAALTEKRIAGAGLDVYWDEPQVPPELLAMEEVVLTPHIGSTTREVREARAANVLANLRAYFAGEPVLTPVE